MVVIQVLGTAQDGGIPHLGCWCDNCQKAIQYPVKRRLVASLAIIGNEQTVMMDATPDIVQQATFLKKSNPTNLLGFDALVLTHLHTGHYTGLSMLGTEAASTKNFPVYMTQPVYSFINSNKPYSYLIDRDQVQPQIIQTGSVFFKDSAFNLTAIEVPHRNEDGNTIGILVTNTSSSKTLLYVPDIDYLTDNIIKLVQDTDIVLLDGSFYSSDELPNQKQVPHPPIKETVETIGKRPQGSFYFTHLNHTNPVIQYAKEYDFILENGYDIAEDFQKIDL